MKKLSIFLITLFMLIGTAYGENYVSLHQYELPNTFCSQSTSLGGPYKTGYPCLSAKYPYKYTRSLHGYRDLYDLNDPRILCGTDYSDGSQCENTEASLSFSLINQRISAANPGRPFVSSFPNGFRIFIPPGTIKISVAVYMPRDAVEGVIVRYKGAPDATYLSYANNPAQYYDVPWESESNVNFDVLQARDVYLKNGGGYANVFPTSGFPPMAPKDSGWLYIRKLPFTSSTIDTVSVNIKVDVAAYLAWYNTAAWDANGDPALSGEPAPTPEPTPVPIPTPTPEPTPTPIPNPTPEPTPVPVPAPQTGCGFVYLLAISSPNDFNTLDDLLTWLKDNGASSYVVSKSINLNCKP